MYPATTRLTSIATQIVDHITATLQKNPKECFILEGYSQGAAATVNALPKITGAAFTAVKGVFLIGNPAHKAGLSCNVDPSGGKSTLDVNGMSYGVQIPANWVSKTMDVCAYVMLPSHLADMASFVDFLGSLSEADCVTG